MIQSHFRFTVIVLVLAVLSLGAGQRTYLCLPADGDAHIVRSSASCELPGECTPPSGESARAEDSVKGHSCLDVELGGDLSDPGNRNVIQVPPPALVSFGPPIILTPSNSRPFQATPRVALPQLVLQRSVVLLI